MTLGSFFYFIDQNFGVFFLLDLVKKLDIKLLLNRNAIMFFNFLTFFNIFNLERK